MRRYLLALSVALTVLLAPSLAFADDGFLGGLQDLTGTRQVESSTVSPEDEYLDEYRPVYAPLASGEVLEVDGPLGGIQSVVDRANTVPFSFSTGESGSSLLDSIRRFFALSGGGLLVLTVSVGLVFMWWGVRKALKMIMAAFRKGRASV